MRLMFMEFLNKKNELSLKLADNVFPYILYIFIVRTRMSAR